MKTENEKRMNVGNVTLRGTEQRNVSEYLRSNQMFRLFPFKEIYAHDNDDHNPIVLAILAADTQLELLEVC